MPQNVKELHILNDFLSLKLHVFVQGALNSMVNLTESKMHA